LSCTPRWFLPDPERNRIADVRAASREEAMADLPQPFDTVPDNTVDKSA
jgi:hypothetical protein